jgi:hypothetical protein
MRAASSSHSTRTQRSSSGQLDVGANDLAASMLFGTCFAFTASSLMPRAALATHLQGREARHRLHVTAMSTPFCVPTGWVADALTGLAAAHC